MFNFWECISSVYQDRRVNEKYGDGQCFIQDCWSLYLIIWYEKYGDGYGVL